MFIVDNSADQTATDYGDHVAEYMARFVEQLTIGRSSVRVGLIQYTNVAHLTIPLDEVSENKTVL